MELVALFYLIDEYCKDFEPKWLATQLSSGEKKRLRASSLSLSEILTIIVYFQMSNHRTFKGYYTKYVLIHLKDDFPNLVSYGRFVELQSGVFAPLFFLLVSLFGESGMANFVDSTTIKVCDNHRIPRHKVFAGIAQRGKSSMGWFYGFKLHLVVNDQGEIVSFSLTPGNVADSNKQVMLHLVRQLTGYLFADRGYISKDLFLSMLDIGVKLVTGIRKNMKNYLMPLWEKLMLRKRGIIETINDQLKNISQIEHTRHRSPTNFFVNLVSGLIAYQLQPKKPRIHLTTEEKRLLTQSF